MVQVLFLIVIIVILFASIRWFRKRNRIQEQTNRKEKLTIAKEAQVLKKANDELSDSLDLDDNIDIDIDL
jgi:membrane protein implicated in regulation of membrane protease activity